MNVKIHRVVPHMEDRLAQLMHGHERERRRPEKDEAISDEIRSVIAERFRHIQWR